MYRYKGVNGSMGLITGNRYEVHFDFEGKEKRVLANVFLTTEPVMIEQGYGDAAPHQPRMPYLFIPYDSLENFKANWQGIDDCRCTNPGKDDGQTTCWEHHNCSDGSCTHGD